MEEYRYAQSEEKTQKEKLNITLPRGTKDRIREALAANFQDDNISKLITKLIYDWLVENEIKVEPKELTREEIIMKYIKEK
jgi:hypothetical protein